MSRQRTVWLFSHVGANIIWHFSLTMHLFHCHFLPLEYPAVISSLACEAGRMGLHFRRNERRRRVFPFSWSECLQWNNGQDEMTGVLIWYHHITSECSVSINCWGHFSAKLFYIKFLFSESQQYETIRIPSNGNHLDTLLYNEFLKINKSQTHFVILLSSVFMSFSCAGKQASD